MGNRLNIYSPNSPRGDAENTPAVGSTDRKRKRESTPERDQNETESLDVLNTPKRKKLMSTSKYIYQTLFLDGENSDVTIHALNTDWKLHKLYLKQSPYFSGMFSGSWKESKMEKITIEIVDENITEESLKIAFGSLYKDDVFLKPVQVVGVLAAATILQLDALIKQCVKMIEETLSPSTIVTYHAASAAYGLEETRKICFDWLLKNILVTPDITYIRDISLALMTDIVASPFMYVIQLEIDVYTLLKKWMYLLMNLNWSGDCKDLQTVAGEYFKALNTGGKCFLETKEGRAFVPVFSKIRWHHVVNDIDSIRVLEHDNVLPIKWLDPVFLYGWRRVLTMEQGLDSGPNEEISEEVFNEACNRCGRVIVQAGKYCWRWVGYNFGIDLHISLVNRLLTVKRNTHTESCPLSVTLQPVRNLLYRISIACKHEKGHFVQCQTTGVKKISLGKDEEDIALVLDKDLKYPLSISMNIMLLSPMSELPIPSLKVPALLENEEAPS